MSQNSSNKCVMRIYGGACNRGPEGGTNQKLFTASEQQGLPAGAETGKEA